MNPIVRMLVDGLLKYVERNPNVIEQLIGELVAWIVAQLSATRAAREKAAAVLPPAA